ncbi:hypothetical protein [Halobaculum marinum]|uniref:Uncharacterized protein n=1 Tax=Halobaculum marinum TaxID=3031996 RepID=A0ABD5WXJ6_9EURY|nr:hypothetical protein [Halobaculum sp. DT55]
MTGPFPTHAALAMPLQTATGGSPTVVLLVFAALFVATVLSLYLARRLYDGYRDSGGRPRLLLGVGLVLVTTVPILLRLVLSNLPKTDPTLRSLAVTGCQLLGLLLVLGVIYDRR